jgi:hypothetical protein
MSITRRDIVFDGALPLLFAGSSKGASAVPKRSHSAGCVLANADIDTVYPPGTETRQFLRGDEPMIEHSANRDFDLALAQTLGLLSRQFEVVPGFAYYDDSDGPNASATPIARLKGTSNNGEFFVGSTPDTG